MNSCPDCGRIVALEPDGVETFCGRRVEFTGDWAERMRAAIICREKSGEAGRLGDGGQPGACMPSPPKPAQP